MRPDLVVESLRGNVDTRLKKLDAGTHDAIILAAAGLARLGLDPAQLPPHAHLDTKTMLPAVAQGTLAIETRGDDHTTIEALSKLEHAPSRLRAWAERGVLQALGADCTVPLAAYATLSGDELHLEAWLSTEAGLREDRAVATIRSADAARELGLALGKRLL
jgi:hydroxymethylbilane synthase